MCISTINIFPSSYTFPRIFPQNLPTTNLELDIHFPLQTHLLSVKRRGESKLNLKLSKKREREGTAAIDWLKKSRWDWGNAGGMCYGRNSYCYGRSTHHSSHQWSSDSSEACRRIFSFSILPASWRFSPTSSSASSSHFVTLTHTLLSSAAGELPSGAYFYLHSPPFFYIQNSQYFLACVVPVGTWNLDLWSIFSDVCHWMLCTGYPFFLSFQVARVSFESLKLLGAEQLWWNLILFFNYVE